MVDIDRRVADLMAAEAPTGPTPVLAQGGRCRERVAARMAEVGGSWTFLGGFGLALAG